MNNFVDSYNKTITTEQRNLLLRLLIKEITISKNRKIDMIQIQLNNIVVKHLDKKKEGQSSDIEKTHPETALVLKQDKSQWLNYAQSLMNI